MERVSRYGQMICQRSRDEHEQQLVSTTCATLTEQLQQVRSWLEEKKLQVSRAQIEADVGSIRSSKPCKLIMEHVQVGDSLDSWKCFLQLHGLVVAWVEEKKAFLAEPLHLTSLVQARQKSQDYAVRVVPSDFASRQKIDGFLMGRRCRLFLLQIAVKSCKIATKNVSDMGKELSRISQVSSVGALAEQMAEAEQSKTEVEALLQERVGFLFLTCPLLRIGSLYRFVLFVLSVVVQRRVRCF